MRKRTDFVRATAVVILMIVVLMVVGCQSSQYRACTPRKRVEVFNGSDFTGWKLYVKDNQVDPNTVWSVSDKVIRCVGKPRGYIRTEVDWCNYKLHVEWRWPQIPGNSGILFHSSGPDKLWPKCFECQLASGKAGSLKALRGTNFKEGADDPKRKVPRMAPSSEKAAGQWNAADIYCRADTVRIFINGVFQNEGTELSDRAGAICLQSEGRPIEFRNIYIEPLD